MRELEPDGLWTEDARRDPFPVWRRLRNEHPVFYDAVTKVFVLSRHADVASVLNDYETYSAATYEASTGAVLGPTLISMDDGGHVWRRSIVAPELVGARLAASRPILDRAVEELLDRCLGPTGRFDLVTQLTTLLPVHVIADLLGLDGPREELWGWVKAIMAGLAPIPGVREAGIAAAQALGARLQPQIDGWESCPNASLVTRICGATHDGERLSGEEIRAFAGLLFIAGGETTDKAMANLWWNLFANPAVLEAVRSDPALLEACFSETMRRDAPVVYEDRFVRRDVTWHGTTIAAGSRVRVCIAAAHHDESVFADPERFDPWRPDLHLGLERRTGRYEGDGVSGHLGFGIGKHFCVGYELARMETVTASLALLDRAPALAPDGPLPGLVLSRSMRSTPTLPVRF